MRLELVDLTKSYGPVTVLHPLNLTVEDGEFLTILGPSGSGKTTVLRLIGGFTTPSGGRILFDGKDIARLPTFKRPLNTVFQDYALFPHMSVAQNVGYGLMVRGRPKDEIRRKVEETLETVGLSELIDRYPDQLSGGQKQRVALARAIICQPKLILLDEPLGALDAGMRKQMQLFLKRLQRRIRTTFLFVTHDQEEAITMSDRIVVMNGGRLEQLGSPKEIYYKPASIFVAGFFGDNNLIDGRVTAVNGSGLVVETALGAVQVAGSGPGPGTSVKLAIRPESLAVGPQAAPANGSGGGYSGKAVVEEAIFVGAVTQLILRPLAAPDLRFIAKSTSDRGLPELAPEAQVEIRWQSDDASLVVVQ
jgi:ABC-type Fe3+/spermidine/putrescine transport system ATPase subunit